MAKKKRRKNYLSNSPITKKEKQKVVDLMLLGARFTTACRATGRTINGFQNVRRNDKEFDQACKDAEQMFYEMLEHEAESALMRKVREGSMPAITYVLNNRMKKIWKDKPTADEAADTIDRLASFLERNENVKNS